MGSCPLQKNKTRTKEKKKVTTADVPQTPNSRQKGGFLCVPVTQW